MRARPAVPAVEPRLPSVAQRPAHHHVPALRTDRRLVFADRSVRLMSGREVAESFAAEDANQNAYGSYNEYCG
jgi:hypothetical protein